MTGEPNCRPARETGGTTGGAEAGSAVRAARLVLNSPLGVSIRPAPPGVPQQRPESVPVSGSLQGISKAVSLGHPQARARMESGFDRRPVRPGIGRAARMGPGGRHRPDLVGFPRTAAGAERRLN